MLFSTACIIAFASLAAAAPGNILSTRANPIWCKAHAPYKSGMPQVNHAIGIATFNDYSSQKSTNCGPCKGQSGTFGAAASDVSPQLSAGACSAAKPGTCSNSAVMKPYDGPTCPQKNCGACYKVTSKGGYSGEGQGSGLIKKNGSVYVQIIDACPSKSAENTCKGTGPNQIKPEERCSVPASGTPINQLDIDYAAYQQLTGTHRDATTTGLPNLSIDIVGPVACPKA